ncbi:MAG: zf-HC2 domain-containing protein [Candidatus Eiseniibacteriota bacterium]|nr:MAG: zf-HC2 domain-containing protein [Candidatus Eisenbacteria bacterium]
MDCRFIKDNVIDIVGETLPEDTRKEIEAHLRSCKRCAVLTGRFAQLWQAWEDSVSVEPSPAFLPHLWQRIQESEENRLAVPFLLSGWERWLRPTAAVGTIAVGLLIGYHLGNVPADSGPDSVQRLTGQQTLESVPSAELLFDYYLGGLDDFPSGSVGEFYTDPEQNG